jgi:hypothetical protein
MSRYRDLHIHGKHDTIKHLDTLEYTFAFGAAGPFGRVFEDKNSKLPTLIWNVVPESYVPQLKTPSNTLPVQADLFNCGVYVVLTIADLVKPSV